MDGDVNPKAGQCLLCGFAVLAGQGRIAVKSLVHADMAVCKRLQVEHRERQERAMKRMLLRRRLVERAMQRGA